MTQKDKTKEELIEEIKLLQKRIAELETVGTERKQQQQQQMRRLATVVLDSNDAITLRDLDGQITTWNHGAELMYGYSEEEALQMNVRRLTPPDKETEHTEFVLRLMAGETVSSFETQRVAKDGRILDVWLTVTKVLDDTGKPIGIATTERDITERKQAEEALRESEKKFKNMVEVTSDWTWECDKEGLYVYASPRIKNLLGYEASEILGKTPFDLMPEKEIARIGNFFKEKVAKKEAFYGLENINCHKDGHLVTMETSAVPVFDEDGRFKGYRGIDRDITERKQAEEALRESEGRLYTVLETIQEGITFSDETGRFYIYNSAMEKLTGYSREEADICPDFIKLLYPDPQDQQRALQGIEELLEGGTCREVEMRILTKDGQLKYIFIWSSLVLYKGRKIFLSVYRDISERKEMEKRERLAQLGELVADMAHEVNNPLMIISGNAQISLMEEIQNENVKENLKIIFDECRRAKDIIQRLLKFSRPSRGELREIDINKGIEAVVGIVEHQFELSSIEIIRDYTKDLPVISADEQQLAEVFMNLLNNSKDAMPKGGVVTISTSLAGNFLKIDFKDTGCGMENEVMGRIFEPFFTTKEKGTGLGLSVCYGIIRAHNGELKFKSELHKGTIATVLLPLRKDG